MFHPEKEQGWYEVSAQRGSVLAVRANDEEMALLKAEYALQDKRNSVWQLSPQIDGLALKMSSNDSQNNEICFTRAEGKSVKAIVLAQVALSGVVEEESLIEHCEIDGQMSLNFQSQSSAEMLAA